jgi:hypothetical protein
MRTPRGATLTENIRPSEISPRGFSRNSSFDFDGKEPARRRNTPRALGETASARRWLETSFPGGQKRTAQPGWFLLKKWIHFCQMGVKPTAGAAAWFSKSSWSRCLDKIERHAA